MAAFADDVSALNKRERENLQRIFREYERLTIKAGLELNTDKTELLGFSCNLRIGNYQEHSFDIRDLDQTYTLKTHIRTKINGISFMLDQATMQIVNVEAPPSLTTTPWSLSMWSLRWTSLPL